MLYVLLFLPICGGFGSHGSVQVIRAIGYIYLSNVNGENEEEHRAGVDDIIIAKILKKKKWRCNLGACYICPILMVINP